MNKNIILIIVTLILASCSLATESPTPIPMVSPTNTPSATATNTSTVTSTPTTTNTSTVTATITPSVTATNTVTPTITSIATKTNTPTITPTQDIGSIPAFPEAEGFGAYSTGGRGGVVIEVTNLNDSGNGSLRDCVEASVTRTCVFKVNGTITLFKSLNIIHPYITIAGQTASGDGITLRNGSSNKGATLMINTHDVIIRYLRIRTGASQQLTSSNQSIALWSGYNIIIDHVSMSWATDQILTIYTYPKTETLRDVTVQWSFITEGLDTSTHEKGDHSTGVIISSENNSRISMHHNLLAHNNFRHPRISSINPLDVINNVIYNYGLELSFADASSSSLAVNYIGNLILRGPDSITRDNFIKLTANPQAYPMNIFVQGNIDDRYRTDNTLPDNLSVVERSRGFMVTDRIISSDITISSCNSITDCDVYDQVLSNAGANAYINSLGQFEIRRDAVDKRIIEEIGAREGQIIDATSATTIFNPNSEVFLQPSDYTKYGINDPIGDDGWPLLEIGTPYSDQDHDGMPDTWEELYGFNPTNADNNMDSDNDGYTNLEEYLNGTNPLLDTH